MGYLNNEGLARVWEKIKVLIDDKIAAVGSSATINKEYKSTYKVTTPQTVIPIKIGQYNFKTDMLSVFVNGLRLIEGIDYTHDNAESITLAKPLEPIGEVHFVCTKSVNMSTEDISNWESIPGKDGAAGRDGTNWYDSGTGIGYNADLNDYKTLGNYYCSTNLVAETLKNSPVKVAFTMKISYATGTSYMMQELSEHSAQKKWWRMIEWNKTDYGPWRKYGDYDDLYALISKRILGDSFENVITGTQLLNTTTSTWTTAAKITLPRGHWLVDAAVSSSKIKGSMTFRLNAANDYMQSIYCPDNNIYSGSLIQIITVDDESTDILLETRSNTANPITYLSLSARLLRSW